MSRPKYLVSICRGHAVRGLAIIPLIYGVMVCIGLLLGIYATHDQKFPCPDRTPASALAADFLNRYVGCLEVNSLSFDFGFSNTCNSNFS